MGAHVPTSCATYSRARSIRAASVRARKQGCMQGCMHAFMHAEPMHPRTCERTPTNSHVRTLLRAHAHLHACVPSRACAREQAARSQRKEHIQRTPTCTCAWIGALIGASIGAYASASSVSMHMRRYTHARTRTHMRSYKYAYRCKRH